MSNFCKVIAFSALPMLIAPIALAYSESDNKEMRSHGTHVHGLGELNIVVNDNRIDMHWTNPAVNIVGFGVANTDEQKAIVEQARQEMESVDNLFTFDVQAGCQLEAANVEYKVLDAKHDEHGHDEKHDDHHHDNHEKMHDEHHHDDKHESRDGHDHASAGHADFEVNYTFTCDTVSALTTIEVKIHDVFPLIEQTQVQLVTPKTQTALKLNKDSHVIEL